jgi:hypothetical protein
MMTAVGTSRDFAAPQNSVAIGAWRTSSKPHPFKLAKATDQSNSFAGVALRGRLTPMGTLLTLRDALPAQVSNRQRGRSYLRPSMEDGASNTRII